MYIKPIYPVHLCYATCIYIYVINSHKFTIKNLFCIIVIGYIQFAYLYNSMCIIEMHFNCCLLSANAYFLFLFHLVYAYICILCVCVLLLSQYIRQLSCTLRIFTLIANSAFECRLFIFASYIVCVLPYFIYVGYYIPTCMVS